MNEVRLLTQYVRNSVRLPPGCLKGDSRGPEKDRARERDVNGGS